ncbi:MAG TPA: ACP S-malonyltransferase [Candidatus Nanopelagicales bacterium]|nr:ACP S-malonyltransferase [Candidatus Nanopelagicales bacterium]
MIAAVFPGQGSQKKGIGQHLFEAHGDLVARADAILGYSVREICVEDPRRELDRTLYTQPALFVVNALHYAEARAKGLDPDIMAGHSLGEYSALWAAGVFDFETGLRLVRRRAELMDRATGGGMAAVVGLDAARVSRILAEHDGAALDLANLNEPTQVVISGPRAEIERLKPIFEAEGVRLYSILRVSAAFHSRYMEPARREFAAFLDGFTLKPPRIPVISNCTARPHDPGSIKRLLGDQIVKPVRWAESIEAMLAQGVQRFEECGPGKVLTGMVTRIRQAYVPRPTATREAEPRATAPTAVRETSQAPLRAGVPAAALGSELFRKAHRLRYAYVTGAMYKGIASPELVVRIGKAQMLGFLGCGGMRLEAISDGIDFIQERLGRDGTYGMNLLAHPDDPRRELDEVDLFLKKGVHTVEAAAYIQLSPALAWFRLKGVHRDLSGRVVAPHRVLAKVSRPEIARHFLEPVPRAMVDRLVADGRLTPDEARLGQELPLSHDLCVEADSGGHTDMGSLPGLLPAIRRLRDEAMARHGYAEPIRVGAAGGIGTPDAALAAFMLGADFILTGSINQCTPEAGTSERVKDILQGLDVSDTDYAPAGDMFELGSRVQVVRKGLLFPVRANKLYDIYRLHNRLEDIDPATLRRIQDSYFHRDFDSVYEESRAWYAAHRPEQLARAEANPKQRMAMIFKWYFVHSSRLALRGDPTHVADYQIHCGPAMGAFNQWARGSDLEPWRNRHVDVIAERLMTATADLLTRRMGEYLPLMGV